MFLSFTHPVSPWPHWWLSLGKMDSEEERLLKKDIQSVVDQLVLAAEQGNVGAQIRLGIECMVGVNVQKDLVKAEEWLKKGVQGPIGVQDLEVLREQRSRQKISPLAYLLRLAAEKGNVDAQIQFGIACMDGVGLPEDREKAEEWLMEGVRGLVREQRSIENIPRSAMYFFLFHTETHVFFLLSSQFFLRFHFLRSLPSAFSCVKDACISPTIAPSNKICSHVSQYRVANNMPPGKLRNLSSCSWLQRHSLATTIGLAG